MDTNGGFSSAQQVLYHGIATLDKYVASISGKRNILDGLHSIIMYTVCDSSTDRADVLLSGQLNADMELACNIFNIGDNYN